MVLKRYLATEIEKLISAYNFANYYYVPSTTLLWNKSKALNYGISKAITPFVFIADVDLIFHQDTQLLYFIKLLMLIKRYCLSWVI
jgi:hypothetical protein